MEAPNKRPRGRPPKSAEERAAQRERLVDGAMAAVRTHGPDVSMDDLAAAAGVSKPVLYDTFGDKRGLADAVAIRLAEGIEARSLDQLAAVDALDIDAVARAIIGGVVALIDTEPDVYAFAATSVRGDQGLLDNPFAAGVVARIRLLLPLVAPGVTDEQVHVLANGLFGFVYASTESWRTAPGLHRDDLVDLLARIIRTGVLALADDA